MLKRYLSASKFVYSCTSLKYTLSKYQVIGIFCRVVRKSHARMQSMHTYQRLVHPTGCAVLARPGDVVHPSVIRQHLPRLLDLLDAVCPVGVVLAQVLVVDVSVEHHGNRGLVA